MNDSDSDNQINSTTPKPTSRASLPLKFANPNNPISERPVADISVDHLLVKEADLATTTIFYLMYH